MNRTEAREVFRSGKFGTIVGGVVRHGSIRNGSTVRVVRHGETVAQGVTVSSLKRFKNDVTQVSEGDECGLTLDGYDGIQVGDTIETDRN